jgi:hypothetical protein
MRKKMSLRFSRIPLALTLATVAKLIKPVVLATKKLDTHVAVNSRTEPVSLEITVASVEPLTALAALVIKLRASLALAI